MVCSSAKDSFCPIFFYFNSTLLKYSNFDQYFLSMPSMIQYEIMPEKKITLGLNELWHYSELFYFFTWRDIKVKYKQTVLSFAWGLQPLFMMLLFYPVFLFSEFKIIKIIFGAYEIPAAVII
jgi:hypothetical protein